MTTEQERAVLERHVAAILQGYADSYFLMGMEARPLAHDVRYDIQKNMMPAIIAAIRSLPLESKHSDAETVAMHFAKCKDLEEGWYHTQTMFPAGTSFYLHPPHFAEIAASLHYPECWDVAAYPTLESAIDEAKAWQCSAHPPQCAKCAEEELQGDPSEPGHPGNPRSSYET